jgi:hypothetical protein
MASATPAHSDEVKALWANPKLASVRQVLLGSASREALRRVLKTLLPRVGELENYRLQWAEFKPGRKLTAYYDVEVRSPKAEKRSNHAVVAIWRRLGAVDPEEEPVSRLEACHAEIEARGLLGPWQRLMAEVPGCGLRVQCWPLDGEFEQIARVSDPRYVHGMVEALCASRQDPSQQRAAARYVVKPVRYRPGERHVLRYDPWDNCEQGEDHGAIFAKLYQDSEDAARSYRVADCVAKHLSAARVESLAALRPLGCVADDAVILYPLLTGTPLCELLRRPQCEPANYLEQVGSMLSVLHREAEAILNGHGAFSASPGIRGADLRPNRGFAKEVKKIMRRTCEHIQLLLPDVGMRVTELLKRAQEIYERLPQEAPAFAHGDFKAEHVWATADGLTLMDFDSCCVGDPALDVGKFLADLEYWFGTYGHRGVDEAQAEFLNAYSNPETPPERLRRAWPYAALTLMKLAVHRVPLFSDDWPARTEDLVGRAEVMIRDPGG